MQICKRISSPICFFQAMHIKARDHFKTWLAFKWEHYDPTVSLKSFWCRQELVKERKKLKKH